MGVEERRETGKLGIEANLQGQLYLKTEQGRDRGWASLKPEGGLEGALGQKPRQASLAMSASKSGLAQSFSYIWK